MDEYISDLFYSGLQQLQIRAHLRRNGIIMSRSTLQRTLKRLNLYRKINHTPLNIVRDFVIEQIQQSGRLLGYRWMHLRCIQAKLTVSRVTVYNIMKEVDPVGLERRKSRRLHRRMYFSKGTNHMWHQDSYDKLKPYGICINGCIDGFSRHIMWLEAGRTSSDPKVNIQ